MRSLLMLLTGVTLVVTPFLLADGASGNKARVVQPRGQLEWGLYEIYTGAERYRLRLRRDLEKFATRPDYVMFYRDLGRPFPKSGIDLITEAGGTAIISLELWNWHETKTPRLPQINDGDYDAYFRRWAEAARLDGRRVLLRFGFEFNGDWFSWGGDPKAFVKAWRRARKIFDDVGAVNVAWVWSPNITSHPSTPENSMHAYYPGDAYVDWVGVDGYNWGDGYQVWHRWTSFEKLFTPVLDSLTKTYPDKPLMISEFGCPEGKPGQKSQWIREAYAYLVRRPEVRAVVWFHLDKRGEGELNFRIDTSAGALGAFNETFASPRGTSKK